MLEDGIFLDFAAPGSLSHRLQGYSCRNEHYFLEARARFVEDMRHGITLVCHRNGMRVLSYRTAWLTACRRAGVKMKPYAVRHIAATTMLANGADLAAVAAHLGHANVATTGGTYAPLLHWDRLTRPMLFHLWARKTPKRRLVRIWCNLVQKRHKKGLTISRKPLIFLAPRDGVEPPT